MSYYVLAVDGKTYGPVDIEGLKVWFREGRLVANTRLRDAASGRQLLASEVPELSHLFGLAGGPQPYYGARPDPHRCPYCGGAMGGESTRCVQCGTVMGYGRQPRTLITGSLTGDRVFGFIVGFFSWFLWGFGALAALIVYFAVRQNYPIFGRSLGFGLFTMVVLLLGVLAVCFVGMSNYRY